MKQCNDWKHYWQNQRCSSYVPSAQLPAMHCSCSVRPSLASSCTSISLKEHRRDFRHSPISFFETSSFQMVSKVDNGRSSDWELSSLETASWLLAQHRQESQQRRLLLRLNLKICSPDRQPVQCPSPQSHLILAHRYMPYFSVLGN